MAVAGAGTAVLVRAWMSIAASGQALAGPIPGLGMETFQACQVDRALVAHSASYASFSFNAYPLPYELVLTPVCVLPTAAWQLIAVAGSMALGTGALWLWRDSRMPLSVLPALLSPALVQMVQIDQTFSAIGLFGISLAVWAHRRERWVWLGVGVALALIRPINAISVLAMLLLTTSPRHLLRAAAAAAAVAAVPLAASWLVDPRWVSQYEHLLATYRMAGIPQVVAHSFGAGGLVVLALLPAAAAVALVGRPGARPVDVDRSALALALTVVAAPLQGIYVGVFVLPALVRLAERAEAAWIAWIAVGLAWAGVLAASGQLLGSRPWEAYPFLSALAYWSLINAYPLLRSGRKVVLSRPGQPADGL